MKSTLITALVVLSIVLTMIAYTRHSPRRVIKAHVFQKTSGSAAIMFTSDGTLGTVQTTADTTPEFVHKLRKGGFEVIISKELE